MIVPSLRCRLAAACVLLCAGLASAQDPEYSVYVFSGDLTSEFYQLLASPAAEESVSDAGTPDSAPASEEETASNDQASPEEAPEKAPEALIALSGDVNDEDAASTSTLESAPTDEAPEPQASGAPAWLTPEQIVEAVSKSETLRAALLAPLSDEATWQPAKRMVMSPLGVGSRQGAIIAVDRHLRIKQLEIDLTDNIITAVDALTPSQVVAPDSPAAEQRTVLTMLREELAKDAPSAVMIDLLLRRLAELHPAASTPSKS